MPLFEVQIRADRFLTVQRQTLVTRKICIPKQHIAGINLYVQRVTIGSNSLRHNSPASYQIVYRESRLNPIPPHFYPTNDADGFSTHIVQSIVLDVSTEDDILAAVPYTEAQSMQIPLSVVMLLSYHPAPTGGCVLSTHFRNVEWPTDFTLPVPVDLNQVKDAIEKAIRDAFPNTAVPFDFATMLPAGVNQIANAGVSVSSSMETIAFRVDPFGGDSYTYIPWINFYRGAFVERIANPDHNWAYFIHKSTLEPRFTRIVESALSRRKLPGLDVLSVGSHYAPTPTGPQIATTITGYLLPLPGDPYVEFDIVTTLSFSPHPSPQVFMNIDLGQAQAVVDSILNFVEDLKNVMPPLYFIVELFAGDDLKELGGAVPGISVEAPGMVCEKLSDTQHRCFMPAPLPNLNGIRLAVWELVGQTDGVTFAGRVSILNYSPSELVIEETAFSWRGPEVSCGQASNTLLDAVRSRPRDFAGLHLAVNVTATGTEPIYLCETQIINDPLNVFTTGSLMFDRELLPTRIVFEMTPPSNPIYIANPYPLDLLVRTTAGIRLVRVPPPPPFDDAAARWVVEVVRVGLMACPAIPAWFRGDIDRFDLEWIVDPLIDPPYVEITHHFWEIAVEGLAPRRTLTLQDHAGRILAQLSQVSDHQKLTLRAMNPANADAVSLTLTGTQEVGGWAEGIGLEIHQQPLFRNSVVALPGEVRRILPSGQWSPTAAIAVTSGGVVAVDITNPVAPRRLGAWGSEDMADAIVTPEQLLIAHRDRIFAVSADLRTRPLPVEPLAPIVAMSANRDTVHLLTEDALEVRYGTNMQLRHAYPLDRATRMHRLGRELVVADSQGLHLFRIDGRKLTPTGEVAHVGAVSTLAMVSGAPQPTIRATCEDGSLCTFNVHEGNLVEDITMRLPGPQPTSLMRFGTTVVYGQPGENLLYIGTLGRRRLAVPSHLQQPLQPTSTVEIVRGYHSDDLVGIVGELQQSMIPCGNMIRKGSFATSTTSRFGVRTRGLGGDGEPAVAAATVGGVPLTGSSGTVDVPVDGVTFAMEYTVDPMVSELGLTSRGGERFEAPVVVAVTGDAITAAASAVFTAQGWFDGIHPEDIEAVGTCLGRIADRYRVAPSPFRKPSPDPPWAAPAARRMAEVQWFDKAVRLIGTLPGLDVEGRDALLQIVSSQVHPVPTMLDRLGAGGIDFSVPESELTDWLNNPGFTPYAALAEALLKLLDGNQLRRPVFLDVIVFNYEHSPGIPSPRKMEDINFGALETAVVDGSNTRYGEAASNFRELLISRGDGRE